MRCRRLSLARSVRRGRAFQSFATTTSRSVSSSFQAVVVYARVCVSLSVNYRPTDTSAATSLHRLFEGSSLLIASTSSTAAAHQKPQTTGRAVSHIASLTTSSAHRRCRWPPRTIRATRHSDSFCLSTGRTEQSSCGARHSLVAAAAVIAS